MGCQWSDGNPQKNFAKCTRCLLDLQTRAYETTTQVSRMREKLGPFAARIRRVRIAEVEKRSSPPGAFPGRAPTLDGWTFQFQRSAMESFMRDQAPAIAPPATARATTV